MFLIERMEKGFKKGGEILKMWDVELNKKDNM